MDPEAAEIATVNLVMKAFERGKAKRMPLILNQNVKVGNALLSGVRDDVASLKDLEPYQAHLVDLIRKRKRLAELDDDAEKTALMGEIQQETEAINRALNRDLVGTEYALSVDEVERARPFNWAVEFPEVFDPRTPEEERGFTVIVGNPPYVRIQEQENTGPRRSPTSSSLPA